MALQARLIASRLRLPLPMADDDRISNIPAEEALPSFRARSGSSEIFHFNGHQKAVTPKAGHRAPFNKEDMRSRCVLPLQTLWYPRPVLYS